MKQKAFTLHEVLIALVIIGVIAVLTYFSFSRNDEIQTKKLRISTQKFYTLVSNTFPQIVGNDMADEGQRMNSNKYNNNQTFTSEILLTHFLNHIDGVKTSCSNFINNSTSTINLNGCTCAKLLSGMNMAVCLNTSCDTSLSVKEFANENNTFKTYNNTCGSVIYEPKDSSGVFGVDLFNIPLGKNQVKLIN